MQPMTNGPGRMLSPLGTITLNFWDHRRDRDLWMALQDWHRRKTANDDIPFLIEHYIKLGLEAQVGLKAARQGDRHETHDRRGRILRLVPQAEKKEG